MTAHVLSAIPNILLGCPQANPPASATQALAHEGSKVFGGTFDYKLSPLACKCSCGGLPTLRATLILPVIVDFLYAFVNHLYLDVILLDFYGCTWCL